MSPSAKARANGAISNLLESIPDPTFSFKKHHEKRNVSCIFTEEFHKIIEKKRLKKNFDNENLKNQEFAGVKTEPGDYSYSGLK